jgi:tetratricopeptide (TPR) repeat protein
VAFAALKNSLSDSEPLVRAIAALGLHPGPADKEEAVAALRQSLGDSAVTVRIGAAVSLVSLGVSQLPDEDGQRFDEAKKLFEARAELNSDDAIQQLAAGKFYYLTGQFAKAERAFVATLKLDPAAPAMYYLALALTQQQKMSEARSVLEQITPGAPLYAQAQQLLSTIKGN